VELDKPHQLRGRFARHGQPPISRVYAEVARPWRGPLNAYAGESLVEFFAVACEYFFDRPGRLQTIYPVVYDHLKEFFGQDPVERFAD
jgi:Mlc titration factor MtfA (ptsG expression regulator)